jgi:hypothetical protein
MSDTSANRGIMRSVIILCKVKVKCDVNIITLYISIILTKSMFQLSCITYYNPHHLIIQSKNIGCAYINTVVSMSVSFSLLHYFAKSFLIPIRKCAE